MKEKIVIIIFSIIILTIYIFPDITFILTSKKEFKGIALTATNDELFYLSRINGIYKDSMSTLGGIDVYEDRSAPWIRPFIGEWIIGNIGKLFNIPLIYIDILTSSIFPALLFLVFYVFVKGLINSIIIPLLTSLAIILGHNIFSPNLIKDILFNNYAEPLWFLRPISPTVYYFPLFCGLIFIYRSVLYDNFSNILIASLFIGSLFYLNLFHWTFIYAGLGVLLIWFLRLKDYQSSKKIFFIYILSAIVSIPYWIHMSFIVGHPNYEYLKMRYGIRLSHAPIFPIDLIVLIILIVTVNLFLKRDKVSLFLSSFMIGGLICLNQQILTGVFLLPVEWKIYSIKTFSILAIFVTFGRLLSYKIITLFNKEILSKIKYTLFILGASFFIIISFVQQKRYYLNNSPLYLKRQNIANVYDWLNKNTVTTDVILFDPHVLIDDDNINKLRELLTYTNNYSYFPDSVSTFIDKSEFEHRVISALIFFRYSENEVYNFFKYKDGIVFRVVSALKEHGGTAMNNEYLFTLKNKYRYLYTQDPLYNLKRFKVDYIILENSNYTYKKIYDYPFLKKVYEDNSGYKIFKFI